MSGSVLIVDDEPGIREQLAAILGDEGYQVHTAASGEEALNVLAADLFDLVLLDLWLPGIDGLEVLRRLRRAGASPPVVVISGHANAEAAVQAIREGAADFLEKPLGLERVLLTVRNTMAQARLSERLRAEPAETWALTGTSPAITALRAEVERAAASEARVLIRGPNGAGKEVVARLLHARSRRAGGPFIAVNCAAIPAELIESELFGHVKGAFTGAVEARRGRFELANGGTLLLDEVGDMSLLTQAKVLRVLQEARFTRVGGATEIVVDVRVIAATNKDLEQEVEAGRFRRDLTFRLDVIPLRVPAVSERREDIPLLVEEMMQRAARREGRPPKRVSPQALAALAAYDWPGNVREIGNVVERLMAMVPGDTIDVAHLQLSPTVPVVAADGELIPLKQARERFERGYLQRVLERCEGNLSQAARVLGLERSHLYRKLRSLGLR